ncbi:hypothetical protein GCM10022216_32020 [Sphingobacterium kyonggiense]|uniref:Uncharacterized protein n=1 Tax=Sphingobacterium kyonggiense TaxID=714075 RepID=A0ABP7Z3M9_9SPHI
MRFETATLLDKRQQTKDIAKSVFWCLLSGVSTVDRPIGGIDFMKVLTVEACFDPTVMGNKKS